ncbi:hypothetical protein HDU93_006964 [Gonapodya sp. JEL0774]|nr:hypothetical protein HDU93_006964 [Gonapodya sp. JEL0774]
MLVQTEDSQQSHNANMREEFLHIMREQWARKMNVQLFAGFWDVELLTAPLAAWYERETVWTNPTVPVDLFIDIGANVGRSYTCFDESTTISRWMDCRAIREYFLAFEPVPSTYKVITGRAKRLGWDRGNWVAVQAAASNSNGVVPFYASGDTGDEQASFDKAASLNGPEIQVATIRLDSMLLNGAEELQNLKKQGVEVGSFGPLDRMIEFLGNHTITRAGRKFIDSSAVRIYVLKIDAEGFDPDVIRGAEGTIRTPGLVKFLAFEYNDKWFTAGRTETLQSVVTMLDGWGFKCFWVTPHVLAPLWGEWWDPSYEIRGWSNAFCANDADESARAFVANYNRGLAIPGWN